MNSPIRVGIAGAGFSASFHADCYSRNPDVEVVAVASPGQDGIELARKWGIDDTYEDYKELIGHARLDMISVCVPNFLHKDVTVAAADAGINVVCEKPLATTAADGRIAVEACERNGVKLMYGEDWCFIPALVRAEEIIASGGIGRVLYVKAKEVHSGSHSAMNKSIELSGGGSVMNLGVHPIGYVLKLLGEGSNPVVKVTGRRTGGLQANMIHHDVEGEDFALGVLEFEGGEYAFIEANYITMGGMDDVVEIYGTEGVLKIDLTYGSPIRCYSEHGIDYSIEKATHNKGWSFPQFDEYYGLGYVDEIEYFVQCVRFNRMPKYGVNGRSALACLRLVDALYTSAVEERTISGSWC